MTADIRHRTLTSEPRTDRDITRSVMTTIPDPAPARQPLHTFRRGIVGITLRVMTVDIRHRPLTSEPRTERDITRSVMTTIPDPCRLGTNRAGP